MQLTTRQKVLIALLALVLVVLIWQIYLIIKPIVPSYEPKLAKNFTSLTQVRPMVKHAGIKTIESQATLTKDQQNYIALINQYQFLQVQQKIAKGRQKIAEFKLKEAEAVAKLDKIEGKAKQHINFQPLVVSPTKPTKAELVYTGRDQGHWSATLRYDGQLVDIAKDSKIAGLGTVTAINSKSVTLMHDKQAFIITFVGTKKETTPHQTTQLAQPQVKPHKKIAAKPIQYPRLKIPAKAQLPAIKLTTKPKTIAKPKAGKSKKAITSLVQKELKQLTTQTPVLELKPQKQTVKKKSVKAKQALKTTDKKIALANKVPSVRHAKSAKLKRVALRKTTRKNHKMQNLQIQQLQILAQNPNYYTVQLIGSKDLEYLLKFRSNNNLQNQTHYFHTYHKGYNWYGLVHGQFASISDALVYIDSLPPKMQRWNPFVRKVRIIQHEIKKVKPKALV